MATAGATAEATLGPLKIPAPKHFNPKGREEDTVEFETFSQQLKAYLSTQTRRFKDYMNAAEQSTGPINMPLSDQGKELAMQLQSFLTLMCHDKASRIVCRDDTEKRLRTMAPTLCEVRSEQACKVLRPHSEDSDVEVHRVESRARFERLGSRD